MSNLEILQYLAVVIAASLVFSKVLGKMKFPDVTGYLIGGIIIGPMVLNLVPKDAVHGLELISEVALAIIAFSIGSEMKLSALRKTGKGVIVITFLEVLMAFLVVFSSLWLIFGQDPAFSLVLGSIACATAPAATLLVIRQYNAKGPVVDTLIPVVALDDAFCIIAFGICSSVAHAMIGGQAIDALHLLEPIVEIVLSILLGLGFGIVSTFIVKLIRNEGELTSFILGSIFILTSLSLRLELSSLLVMMSFGLAMTNLSRKGARTGNALDGMLAPLFMCFFTLSGADLDFTVFKTVGIVAVAYVIARVIGKMLGAGLGAKICHMEKSVQKYLGLTLIPQAGVAIGLSLAATKILGADHGGKIRAIILAGTVIYELIGPITTKIALTKAGEIKTQHHTAA